MKYWFIAYSWEDKKNRRSGVGRNNVRSSHYLDYSWCEREISKIFYPEIVKVIIQNAYRINKKEYESGTSKKASDA